MILDLQKEMKKNEEMNHHACYINGLPIIRTILQ